MGYQVGIGKGLGDEPERLPIAASACYYLGNDHTVTFKQELVKQIFLLTVCVSGAYLYYAPAEDYAERVDRSDLSWLYIVSTCFPALVVLYVATDTFIKLHFSSRIPGALSHVLVNPQTRAWRYGENLAIAFISMLSAVPLASIMFTFHPEHWKKLGTFLFALLVLVDNTVLHFFPVKLILNQPIYRLPFLPLEYLVKALYVIFRDRHLSASDKTDHALQAQIQGDHMQLRTLMIQRITLAQQNMMQQSFQWSWRGLRYNAKAPENVCNLAASEKPLDLVLSFLPKSASAPWQIPGKLNTLLLTGVGIIGALWICSCASGYYAAPFNQFYEWTGSYAAAAGITALPLYSLSVLLAFFGVFFLSGLYSYATTWGDGVTKIPMEVKLYPKLFILMMAVNGVLAGFSYAAAVELVYTGITYDWAKPLVPMLVGLAKSGIPFVGFLATRDFFMLMFLKVAAHWQWSGNNHRLIAKTNEKIEQFKNSIMYMEGGPLEAVLSAMTEGERVRLLGIDDGVYDTVINHVENFKRSQRPKPSWYSFLPGCGVSEEDSGQREPLRQHSSLSYST